MCSAIITRNIFIVNAVHTVLQDLLLPPGSIKIVSYYNWQAGTLILVLQIFMHKFCMNTNKFCMNTHEFAWTCINFTWTWINFAWTRMNLHEHAWKLIKISGCAVDIWAVWPVSEIGTLIFVAVFKDSIILLKICEIHLQVSSIHTL